MIVTREAVTNPERMIYSRHGRLTRFGADCCEQSLSCVLRAWLLSNLGGEMFVAWKLFSLLTCAYWALEKTLSPLLVNINMDEDKFIDGLSTEQLVGGVRAWGHIEACTAINQCGKKPRLLITCLVSGIPAQRADGFLRHTWPFIHSRLEAQLNNLSRH